MNELNKSISNFLDISNYYYLPRIDHDQIDLSELVLFLYKNRVPDGSIDVYFYDSTNQNRVTLNTTDGPYFSYNDVVINADGYIEEYVASMFYGKHADFKDKDAIMETIINNNIRVNLDFDKYKEWIVQEFKTVYVRNEDHYRLIMF